MKMFYVNIWKIFRFSHYLFDTLFQRRIQIFRVIFDASKFRWKIIDLVYFPPPKKIHIPTLKHFDFNARRR